MTRVNQFSIEVTTGGYPVWVSITYGNDYSKQIRFSHSELRDLEYAIKSAMREARQQLPDQYKGEV